MAGLTPAPARPPLGPEVRRDTRPMVKGVATGTRCRTLFTRDVLSAEDREG
ncbi:MAG: hypothetical protein ACLQGP_24020 [Isosphaeraceae bacterium]